MKAGYFVYEIIDYNDSCIEVINYIKSNEVLCCSWLDYSQCLENKSKSSIGVWKLKK
jgi:hypothetical protein